MFKDMFKIYSKAPKYINTPLDWIETIPAPLPENLRLWTYKDNELVVQAGLEDFSKEKAGYWLRITCTRFPKGEATDADIELVIAAFIGSEVAQDRIFVVKNKDRKHNITGLPLHHIFLCKSETPELNNKVVQLIKQGKL